MNDIKTDAILECLTDLDEINSESNATFSETTLYRLIQARSQLSALIARVKEYEHVLRTSEHFFTDEKYNCVWPDASENIRNVLKKHGANTYDEAIAQQREKSK